MVEEYPDRWVILDEVEWERGVDIVSGVVVGIYSDEEIDDAFLDFEDEGKFYTKERTTERHDIAIMGGKYVLY